MISCHITGGLGNQLFQIFTTISHALKHTTSFVFPRVKRDIHHRQNYWHVLTPLLQYTTEKPINLPIYKEQHFHYSPLPNMKTMVMDGYFQSYKYFEDNFEQIFKLCGLDQKRQECSEKYKYPYNDSVSIHFRIGDYKKNPQYHPLTTDKYYINALKHVENDISNVLYFSEQEDENYVNERIKNFKTQFPSLNFIQVPYNIEDWEQMLIMSLCKNNIIANSTFSWWGAYFNNNFNKIVIYPSKWFGEIANLNTKDLCPPTWVKY